MKDCTKCGCRNANSAKFCNDCGSKIKEISEKKDIDNLSVAEEKKESEDCWICEGCSKEFKSKSEAIEHEKNCQQYLKDYNKMTVVKLKSILKERGLSVSGTKNVLIHRLEGREKGKEITARINEKIKKPIKKAMKKAGKDILVGGKGWLYYFYAFLFIWFLLFLVGYSGYDTCGEYNWSCSESIWNDNCDPSEEGCYVDEDGNCCKKNFSLFMFWAIEIPIVLGICFYFVYLFTSSLEEVINDNY